MIIIALGCSGCHWPVKPSHQQYSDILKEDALASPKRGHLKKPLYIFMNVPVRKACSVVSYRTRGRIDHEEYQASMPLDRERAVA